MASTRSPGPSYLKYFTPAIKEALEAGETVNLEKFLRQVDDAYARVFVSATESLSGSRTVSIQNYTLSDIRIGRFKRGSFDHTGLSVDDPDTRDEAPEAEVPM